MNEIKDLVNEHSELMSNRDAQVSHALNRLSWQMKPDYLLATHTPADTRPFIAELDELTRLAAKRGLGIDFTSPDGPDLGGRLDVHFSSERIHLPARHGGSGILRLKDRADLPLFHFKKDHER